MMRHKWPLTDIAKPNAWLLGAGALILLLCTRAIAGHAPGEDSFHSGILARFAPIGGWHPDSGGLCHWWNPNCFPRCGGPDTYCRKPPPNTCWPPYPPFYVYPPPAPCVPCQSLP